MMITVIDDGEELEIRVNNTVVPLLYHTAMERIPLQLASLELGQDPHSGTPVRDLICPSTKNPTAVELRPSAQGSALYNLS